MPLLAVRRPLAALLVPMVLLGPLADAGRASPGAPPVALLVVPAPDLSARVGESLRNALVARMEAEGLQVAAGDSARPLPRPTVEALRAGLAAGRAAFEALDAERARERFGAVTAALEADTRLVGAAPDLLDAPFLLGVVALGLGDVPAADAAFERLLRLAPDFEPPAGRYAPDVEHALATTRVRLEALRPSRLAVAARPQAVDLFVDGVHRGRTPLTLEPLSPGAHEVLAQRREGPVEATRVHVTRFGPHVLELSVPAGGEAPGLVGLARRLSAADAALDLAPGPAAALAQALGTERLLLVWVEGTSAGLASAAAFLDLSAGRPADLLELAESPDVATAADRVGAWVALAAAGNAPRAALELLPDWRTPAGAPSPDALPPIATLPAGDASPAPSPERWYRKWYWWALIGAGVAAGAAALASGGGGGGGGTGAIAVTP